MIQAGCLLTILVFVGIPLLILFLSLLFSGGMGTLIAIATLIIVGFLAVVLTQ